MIVAESTRTRRLIGRLDRGSDLLTQLADVCRAHNVRSGELRATGAVEEATIGEWDQRAHTLRVPRRFAGGYEILSLSGTIGERDGAPSLQAWISLGREHEGGIEHIGGRLVSARVFACEFVIDTFDDLTFRRAVDNATGLALWQAAVAKSAPTFEAPARTTWSDVVAASERRTDSSPTPSPAAVAATAAAAVAAEEEANAPPSSEEAVVVRAGDFIDHPQFGRCAVERVDRDQEFVTARLRNQRLIRLSLDVLTLIPAGQADGKNLFRAVAGK